MLYVRLPLSLCNVEDLVFERGYDLCHETVRLWWNRFGPLFASEIRRKRVTNMRGFRHWICPLLSGPSTIIVWTLSEKMDGQEASHVGGDYRQVA